MVTAGKKQPAKPLKFTMSLPDLSILPPPPDDYVGWSREPQPPELAEKMSDGRSWPKISIVTPSYNQGQYIEETIRSVLLQGYPNLEYMVIDGGSTDLSIRVIQKYKPWLTYAISEEDEGQADAIAKGFQRATGEILAWLNSDDYYEPGAFQRIAKFFMDDPELVFTNGDVNAVDENSQLTRRIYAMRPSVFFAANYGQHGWPQQGCFWRRSVYEQVGGMDTSLQFCMDKDLFIRLVSAGSGRRIPGPPLANFRFHNLTKTATLNDVAQRETADIIKKYGQHKWSSRPRLMQALWWLYRKQAALRLRLNRTIDLEY